MEMNRRALYNSLRMNWVLDPTLEVEAWQVEDYRSIPSDALFEKLEDHHIRLDKMSFVAYADQVDSPEDLTELLLGDAEVETKKDDQIYLWVFELWRRLLPEKPSLSILCDELDHQIHLYDREQTEDLQAIQDALANLQVVLDENVDNGMKPVEALDCINAGCANNLESFLHDYIADQVDNENDVYARELLEGFGSYVRDVKWIEFLKARLLESTDPTEANLIVKKLIEKKNAKNDLEFNLEVLAFLVRSGDEVTFKTLSKRSLDLAEYEEDFQFLLSIAADFYHRLDKESKELSLQEIVEKRKNIPSAKAFDRKDPQAAEFVKILSR